MISTLEDFQKFLKICRKQGVNSVEYNGTKVDFGALPKKDGDTDEDAPEPLSPEQLMFYSAGVQG